MAKVCDLTGKKPLRGNNVSHSNKKTRRHFKPNLHDKKFYIPEEDVWVKLRVSAKAMKTIDKIGIMEYLKREGYELDI